MFFSFIIPVYNRPDEVEELLNSLTRQSYNENFEIVIIEDGSVNDCRDVVEAFKNRLRVSYYYKKNSGPGDSRNYGMKAAKGDYYIILDSDCILPVHYLQSVADNLAAGYVDCFGGPDAALDSFSNMQKAINFTMTSFLTTGGVRGKSEKIEKFQPRSFNMGLSKQAFEASGGFGNIHPGEDPDLSIRLWKLGYKTELFHNSFVYHKRRIDLKKFYIQVNKFGKARPILDLWHPEYKKLTFVFPTLFITGLLISLILLLINVQVLFYSYILYFILVSLISGIRNKSIMIGVLSMVAAFVQFYGYGLGYIKSWYKIHLLKQYPEKAFPELFFK
jgi:glycosyltransferase involved in cell wall biosynthesis